MIAAIADKDILPVRAVTQRCNPVRIAFEFRDSETAYWPH